MDVGAISPNGDLYMKVYSWHNQIVFCCGKKRTLGYYLMTTDHRIVVSKVMWEQRKVLGFKLRKMQDDKLQICKVQRWEIPFPQSSKKKVIMTSNLDKKNLGEYPFARGMEIHWYKRKRGIRTIAKSILRKEF